jgi:valyl-tRNA synthetase
LIKLDINEAYEAESIFNYLSDIDGLEDKAKRLQEIFMPIIENEKGKEFKRKLDVKISWKNFVPHREVSKAITALTNSISLYEEAKQEILTYQRVQQDILHALELTDLSEVELVKLMKELQEIRIYRRQAKNFMESVEPLVKFANNHKSTLKELGKVQGELNKITQSINERQYYVREKKALADAFKEADHMYERMERLSLKCNR